MTPTAHDAPGVDDASAPTAAHDAQDMRAVLRCLAGRPLDEHAEVYRGLHADLHAALAEIDGT